MKKPTLADLHQREKLGMMKVKIKKEHEIELQLPAYFSHPKFEAYIKINKDQKMQHIRMASCELVHNVDPFLIDYVISDYTILDPKEGEKIWTNALNELKARINSL